MAQIVFTVAVNIDRQELGTIVPLDSQGNPAQVDAAGFVKESAEGADVITDPRGGTLDLIVKPGTEVGATGTVSGYIDADTGEGVKRIDVTFAVTTIAAEATGASFSSRGSEALGAEVTEPPVEPPTEG